MHTLRYTHARAHTHTTYLLHEVFITFIYTHRCRVKFLFLQDLHLEYTTHDTGLTVTLVTWYIVLLFVCVHAHALKYVL